MVPTLRCCNSPCAGEVREAEATPDCRAAGDIRMLLEEAGRINQRRNDEDMIQPVAGKVHLLHMIWVRLVIF